MPIYMPSKHPGQKAKRRTTAAERRSFVAGNIRKLCSVAGCHSCRVWTSTWCANHRGKQAMYGHPEGRGLDPVLVETYRAMFASWLELYEDTPQVTAALEVMSALLRGKLISRRSLAQRELSRLREGERHPGDYVTGPITAREALEVVGGVYWLALFRPEVLKTDDRLTYALCTYLYKMKIMDARPRVSRTGKAYNYRPKAAATGKRELGSVIRRDLAVFLTNAWDRHEGDYRAHARRKLALKEPMASVTGAPPDRASTPDNATSAPPGPTPGAPRPTTRHDQPTTGHTPEASPVAQSAAPAPLPPQPPRAAPRKGQPGPAAATPGEPTTAQLVARSKEVLARLPTPVPQPPAAAPQSPQHPAPVPQTPAQAAPQPAAPTPSPQATPQPAAAPDTPLLPSTLVLERRPSTSSHHDAAEPTGDDAAGTFGSGVGSSNFGGGFD